MKERKAGGPKKKAERERNEGTENLQCRRFPFRAVGGAVQDGRDSIWGGLGACHYVALRRFCFAFGLVCFGFVVAIKYIITVS